MPPKLKPQKILEAFAGDPVIFVANIRGHHFHIAFVIAKTPFGRLNLFYGIVFDGANKIGDAFHFPVQIHSKDRFGPYVTGVVNVGTGCNGEP
jgi:hypothetical protein